MMPIRSRAAAAAVHILTALCAAVGVVLQCGFIGGKLNLAVLQYFTLMSNILCAVYFTGAAVHTLRRGGTWLPVCKGALVMAMAITGASRSSWASLRQVTMRAAVSSKPIAQTTARVSQSRSHSVQVR